MRSVMLFVSAAAAFFIQLAPASAQMDDIWRAGARVHAVASDHENVSAAGAIVSVRGTVRQDVRAAGAEVDADASAGRDSWLAGAIVTARGSVARHLYAAGARVSVDAKVGEKLSVAGARVLIGPQTDVSGPARIAGAEVAFSGTARRGAEIYGDTVQIDGRISGDLRIVARQMTVGKGAVIDGNVRFESFNEPVIEEGAQITGKQTVTLPQPRRVGPENVIAGIGAIVLFAVGAGFLLGLILLAGARGFIENSIMAMREAPLRSALIGLGVLILLPILAVVLMVTIVGVPIGLLTLLAFPLLLFIGSVLAAFGLSDRLFNRVQEPRSFGARLLYLIGGLLILVLLGLVPFLGFVTWMLALMFGLGGLWQALRGRTAGAAIPAAA
ncbi:MAG: polymer-forming cytoskeletal protein [Bradyrhizobiaceae bacterium]|nr:polymer-forming cytoskeletal protein [Bradyrhizobiaceae bacterium]